jgi:hypothetical protein
MISNINSKTQWKEQNSSDRWDGMGCQEQKYLNTVNDVCLSFVSNNKHFTSKENYV